MSRPLVQTNLIITKTTAKEECRSRKDEINPISTLGQRKLLSSPGLDSLLFHWNTKEVINPFCVYGARPPIFPEEEAPV
jgi:hypothetical protein